MANPTYRPTLWAAGDWNAFFGFGTNILVNMLTLTALLRFVLKMPDALVFGAKCRRRVRESPFLRSAISFAIVGKLAHHARKCA